MSPRAARGRPAPASNDASRARSAIERQVLAAVEASLTGSAEPVLLAVSGGLDSMVLLDAAARVAPARIGGVATFDHRSGPHSRAAVAFVRAESERRGLRILVGQASGAERSEAGWRAARWSFLSGAARSTGARIATAHTADDQVETVCMRILRDAGARGLAGLLAESPILRPLLGFRRRELATYAVAAGIEHIEDPTNASPEFLRNRLRRDLLPAIARVRPGFATEITRLSERAADVRRTVDRIAGGLVMPGQWGTTDIPLQPLDGMTPDSLEALAPALAARCGVILDRRGTTRLSQFILRSRTGARIQLSGGAEALRLHDRVAIRRAVARVGSAQAQALAMLDVTVAGRWRLRLVERSGPDDPWTATLPADRALTVREWRAGDRMRAAGSGAARRVKRFFSDAGITGPERDGWPVVLADGEIVWIPGVRRSDAATDRSGRPVLRYRCERNDL